VIQNDGKIKKKYCTFEVIVKGTIIPIIIIPDNLAKTNPSILFFEKENTIRVTVKLNKQVKKVIANIRGNVQLVIENTEITRTEITYAIDIGNMTLEIRYPFFPKGVTHKWLIRFESYSSSIVIEAAKQSKYGVSVRSNKSNNI
jgi:hypothetical protein